MSTSPLSSLFGIQEVEKRQNDNKYYGVVMAVVTDNVHGMVGPIYGTGSLAGDDYRVRVKFPWLPKPIDGEEQTFWCRISALFASKSAKGVGSFFLPEIGDEVLVVFEMGDFDKPI